MVEVPGTADAPPEWPAALGSRPLDIDEAEQALRAFAARHGHDALLLLMHAAVPETLRADLLHLIRINFLPELADPSIEADVLFAPLTQPGDGDGYRIDAEVRWQALLMLRSRYRHEPRSRLVRVAELLWRHLDDLARGAAARRDPLLAEYIEVQRWVALAYLDPAGTAEAFAQALKDKLGAGAGARLRMSGVATAIELPLSNQPELLAYARSLDAVHEGRADEALRWRAALGDAPLSVGTVTLPAVQAWWPQAEAPPARGGAADSSTAAQPHGAADRQRCLLLHGYELEDRAHVGESMLPRLLYETLDDIADVEFLEPGSSLAQVLRAISDAPVLVVDISSGLPTIFLLLGLAWGLCSRVVVVAHEAEVLTRWMVDEVHVRYGHADREYVPNRRALLAPQLVAAIAGTRTSPVYRLLPLSEPPTLRSRRYAPPARPPKASCLVVGTHAARDREPGAAGITLSFDEVRWALDKLKINPLGAPSTWDDASRRGGDLRATIATDLMFFDWPDAAPDDMVALGVRLAMRPTGTIVAGVEQGLRVNPFPAEPAFSYAPEPAKRRNLLLEQIARWLQGTPSLSPVYQALPELWPPPIEHLKDTVAAPPRAEPQPKIFLSYSRAFAEVAHALATALERSGQVRVVWDARLQAGDDWYQQLRNWLEESDAVLVVAGPGTEKSRGVLAEIEAAERLGKRLIPVFVGGWPTSRTLPPALADRQGVMIHYGSAASAGFEQDLERAVADILAAVAGDGASSDPEPAGTPPDPPLQVSILRGDGDAIEFGWSNGQRALRETIELPSGALMMLESARLHGATAVRAVQGLAGALLPAALVALTADPRVALRLEVDGSSGGVPWELLFSAPFESQAAPGAARDLIRSIRPRPSGMRSAEALLVVHGSAAPRRGGAGGGGPQPLGMALQQALKRSGLRVKVSVDAGEAMDLLQSRPWRVVVVCAGPDGHGQRDGLAMRGSSWLGLEDILALKRPPEFLLFDAALTPRWDAAVRGLVSRQTVINLAAAGTECIVLAGWGVPEPAAQAFDVSLLESLAQGATIEQAAVQARRAAAAIDERSLHSTAYEVWSRPGYFLAAPGKPR